MCCNYNKIGQHENMNVNKIVVENCLFITYFIFNYGHQGFTNNLTIRNLDDHPYFLHRFKTTYVHKKETAHLVVYDYDKVYH